MKTVGCLELAAKWSCWVRLSLASQNLRLTSCMRILCVRLHLPFDRKLAVRVSGCGNDAQYSKALQILQTVLGIKYVSPLMVRGNCVILSPRWMRQRFGFTERALRPVRMHSARLVCKRPSKHVRILALLDLLVHCSSDARASRFTGTRSALFRPFRQMQELSRSSRDLCSKQRHSTLQPRPKRRVSCACIGLSIDVHSLCRAQVSVDRKRLKQVCECSDKEIQTVHAERRRLRIRHSSSRSAFVPQTCESILKLCSDLVQLPERPPKPGQSRAVL